MTNRDERRTRARPTLSAGIISLIYLVGALVWILTGDLLLGSLALSATHFIFIEIVKGVGFVVVTAVLLFFFIRRGHRHIQTIERQTHEQLRFQHDVLAQVSDAVAYAGTDGKLVYANSSALRLYGVAPGDTHELLGRQFSEVVNFEWIDPGDEHRCAEALTTRGRWRGEVLLKTRHRKRIFLDCDITLVKDNEGNHVGALAIARDVTDQRHAEEKLRRSEERLALHFELVPLAAIEWDENMTVLRWNDAAEKIFGFSKAEMIGRSSWHALVPESDRPKVEEVIHRLLEKGEPVSVTNRNVTKDGRQIICEWFNTPLSDELGRPIGVASLAADITERRRDQRRLQESLRVQRLLLSELDHRVKNALSGLITMVDLTREKSGSIDGFAAAVRRRVEAMARVHAMLSQSRWSSLDLREIIGAMRPPEAPGHIHLDGPDVEIPVRHATPLGMAIQELMSNSLKHGALSTSSGRVDIRWGTHQITGNAGSRELWLEWRERGGPPIDRVPESGLGTSLIEGFCRFELGGRVEFDYPRDGARHSIHVLLDDHAGDGVAQLARHASGQADGQDAAGTPMA